MPTNLSGLPVTALTESAAPPRASPSSLVSTTPSNPRSALNFSAMLHGFLARHGVRHEQDLVGLHPGLDLPELVHERLVDLEPARGIEDHDLEQR